MTDQQPHTPTIYDIEGDAVTRDESDWREAGAQFDRWLATVEAAAEQRGAARALRDAEEFIDAELQDSPAPNYEEDNYDAGRIDGLTFSQEHLRNRADRLEAE